jgi:hypothetical protein
MPKTSHIPKTKPALSPALASHLMMTLDDVCAVTGLSRRGLLNLRKSGQGPELTHFGTSVRVSQEAFAAWRQRLTEKVA